jgi:energy-coupling factor transport system ATP-binding protein
MLQLKNVSFSYNKGLLQEVQALSGINLSIEENEFISILGSNGSGKSTIAELLSGLLKPTAGEALLDSSVGLLFQNPDSQIVGTIVEEDVAFGPQNQMLKREEIIECVDTSLEAVGMSAFRLYEPHTLSAGQKQKVALASVLAMKPKFLVLDEPTSYLDPASRLEVLNLLQEVNRQGIAIINITHYADQIFYGHRVVVVEKGKVSFDGKVGDFFKNKEAMATIGASLPLWLEIKEKYGDIYAR